ncbi:MAG: hypothetical protein ACP5E4_04575 [Candidatus Aenigmatarchaeota archaeon]
MGDEGYHYDAEKPKGLLPYRHKFSKGEIKAKLGQLKERLEPNKKIIAIAIGLMLIVIVGGTITGNFLTKSGQLDECQSSLSEAYVNSAEMSKKLSSLELDKNLIETNLGTTTSQLEKCLNDYNTCYAEKNTLNQQIIDLRDNLSTKYSELKFCTKDLDSANSEVLRLNSTYQKLEERLEDLQGGYASYKCCQFYEDGYKYYIIVNGKDVRCCYNGDEGYMCGFGPSEEEVDDDERLYKLKC